MSNSSDSDCLPDLEEEMEIANLERTQMKRKCQFIWCATCHCVFHSARKYHEHQERKKHFQESHHDEKHPKMNPKLSIHQMTKEEISLHQMTKEEKNMDQVPKGEPMSPLFSSESSSSDEEENLHVEEVRPLSVEIEWHFY